MTSRKKEMPQDRTWLAFKRRHPGNPFLAEDPLYAMTEDVIDFIKENLPEFFSPQQETFERDLARMTGGGFFLHRPLGQPTSILHKPGLTIGEFLQYATLSPHKDEERTKRLSPELKPEWFKDEFTKESMRAICDMMVTLWRASGREEMDIDAALRQESDEGRLMVRRGEAYSAWLLLNPQFRKELGELRTAWAATIAHRGGFPQSAPAQVSPENLPAPHPRRDRCAKACLAFYRRWCLDRMLTWELPAPLDARLHHGASESPEMTPDEGVTVRLPWYLLRGGQLDLQAVIHRIRFESAPEHLSEWVHKRSERQGDQAGEISYQRLYWLYRCYELILFRRYRTACENNIERLDRTLGTIIGLEQDWVKRLRQRLARELHGR